MMRQFPTGFTINAEKNVENTMLNVELPTKNGTIQFERSTTGGFDISLVDNFNKTKHKISKNCPIKAAKEILDYVLTPHKDMDMKKIAKEIKKLTPKKHKRHKKDCQSNLTHFTHF